MASNFITEIKSSEWSAINNKEYVAKKYFEFYVKNAVVTCTDNLGNSLLIATRNEDYSITFTSTKIEDIKIMISIPTNLRVVDGSTQIEQFASSYLNEDKGYVEINHLNEEGLPVVEDKIETHSVSAINSSIQLTDIPDQFYGLILEPKDTTISLIRVYNIDELEKTNFSYYIGKNNMIYCSHDLIGKYITVKYKGMGKIIINCNMIYYRDKVNNIPIILEDMIDKGQEQLNIIGTLGDAVQIINSLKETTNNAKLQQNSLIETISSSHDSNLLLKDTINLADASKSKLDVSIETGNTLHTTLTNDISVGNTLHETLTNDITTGNALHTTLTADNTEANRIQPILHQDVLDANTFVTNHGDIIDLDNRVNGIENDKLTSIETDVSLTKLNNVIDGNVIVDKIQGKTKYKRADGTITDVWESGVTLISVGEDNGNKIEISSIGKNLWDIEATKKYISTYDTSAVYLIDDGKNVVEFDESLYLNNRLLEGAFLPNTQYCFSSTAKKIGGSSFYIVIYYTDGTLDKLLFATDTTKYVKTTKVSAVGKSISHICFSYGSKGYKTRLSLDDLQINIGDTLLPYEPYKTDKSEISLSSPLSEWDYIDKNGVHRKTLKQVIDNSYTYINFQSTNSYNITNFYFRVKTGIVLNANNIICDKLKLQNSSIANETGEGFTVADNAVYIRIKCETIGCLPSDDATVKIQKFKVWLQTNPQTFLYEDNEETIEPLNSSLILSAFKDGYFGLNCGAINPVVSLRFPTTIGGRVDSLEESNYQLKKDYYSTLKTLIKTADDCLKLELNKQNKVDNVLTTTSKEIVGSINELNNNKVTKVTGKELSTNDFTNEYKLAIDNMKTELTNLLLPIGITVAYQTNINPNVLYTGQTWVRSFKGQVMVGVDETQTEFNAVDKTGGEKTHTLTEQELPTVTPSGQFLSQNTETKWAQLNSGTTYGWSPVGSIGGNQPHNNLQPYKTTYFWTRTA